MIPVSPPIVFYWSTDGSVPGTGSNDYFSASKNRCASSFSGLSDAGRFTPERARRWVNSTIQQGQCTTACPAGETYRNPPGPNNAGCYQQVTNETPAPKLRFVESTNGANCNQSSSNSLTWVKIKPSNERGCYDTVTTLDPISGWVYRQNDSGKQLSFWHEPSHR